MTEITVTLADHWVVLATTSLLGTARRRAPEPPAGALAGIVAAAQAADDAEAVLVQVAALGAARRAGVKPSTAPAPIAPCGDDDRSPCPRAASKRLTELLDVWPELVDEFLDLVCANGYRLPGEHAVTLLARHRHDEQRRPLIERAAGPLAPWLSELFPAQFATRRARASAAGSAREEPFPLPAELAALVGAPAGEVIDALVDGLTRGAFANRHRPLLVHLVRQLPIEVLDPLAEALSRAGTNASTLGLTMSLADLARTRAQMFAELARAAPPAAAVAPRRDDGDAPR